MVYYQLTYDPSQRLGDICQSAIGRRPTVIGYSGNLILLVEFNPQLTTVERTKLVNALPPLLRDMYTIEVKEGTLSQPSQ